MTETINHLSRRTFLFGTAATLAALVFPKPTVLMPLATPRLRKREVWAMQAAAFGAINPPTDQVVAIGLYRASNLDQALMWQQMNARATFLWRADPICGGQIVLPAADAMVVDISGWSEMCIMLHCCDEIEGDPDPVWLRESHIFAAGSRSRDTVLLDPADNARWAHLQSA